MKSTQLLAAVVVLASFAQVSEAGLFNKYFGHSSAKCCDCAPTCQPDCCKPVIVRPDRHCNNAYSYQRRCSTLKRPNCDSCCAPAPCCPSNSACCDTGCGNGCCDSGCGNDGCCDTGCGNDCCDTGCCDAGCCGDGCCDDSCCDDCCDIGCCDDVCCDDSCVLAELIYESQTACYARQRRRAVRRMSGKFDCVCYPELMCALTYALNDTDERVRAQAANEIGDELHKNPCCCCQEIVSALTCALGDCDWRVRWQAKRALKQCGYKVVKPCYDDCCEVACCDTGCCDTGCTSGYAAPANNYSAPVQGHIAPTAPADLPPGDAAPAPAPVAPAAPQAAPAAPAAEPMPEAAPEPPSAYFPKFYPRHSSVRPAPARKGLAGLLGLSN